MPTRIEYWECDTCGAKYGRKEAVEACETLAELKQKLTGMSYTPEKRPDLLEEFRKTIVLPVKYKWVAVDENGDIYGYDVKPELNRQDLFWITDLKHHVDLGEITIPDHINWKDCCWPIAKWDEK